MSKKIQNCLFSPMAIIQTRDISIHYVQFFKCFMDDTHNDLQKLGFQSLGKFYTAYGLKMLYKPYLSFGNLSSFCKSLQGSSMNHVAFLKKILTRLPYDGHLIK